MLVSVDVADVVSDVLSEVVVVGDVVADEVVVGVVGSPSQKEYDWQRSVIRHRSRQCDSEDAAPSSSLSAGPPCIGAQQPSRKSNVSGISSPDDANVCTHRRLKLPWPTSVKPSGHSAMHVPSWR